MKAKGSAAINGSSSTSPGGIYKLMSLNPQAPFANGLEPLGKAQSQINLADKNYSYDYLHNNSQQNVMKGSKRGAVDSEGSEMVQSPFNN